MIGLSVAYINLVPVKFRVLRYILGFRVLEFRVSSFMVLGFRVLMFRTLGSGV